jgi:hypothetical protein
MFTLAGSADRSEKVREGTRQIMQALAGLLPDEYRGAYKSSAVSRE